MIILLLIFFSMETPLHKLHLKGCVMYQVFVALEKLLSKRKGAVHLRRRQSLGGEGSKIEQKMPTLLC